MSTAAYARIDFGPFGDLPPGSIHSVVIALLAHPVAGHLICLMGALGLLGWAQTYLP